MAGPLGKLATAADLAAWTGEPVRTIRYRLKKCHEGHPYNGHHIEVRALHGRGGRSGLQYLVEVDSLPAELRKCVPAEMQDSPTRDLSQLCDDSDGSEAWWRYHVIQSALSHPSGSSERALAVQKIAAGRHLRPDGDTLTVAARTARIWIAAYEAKGLAGLKRKPRADRGGRRVHISREYDRSVPFDAARLSDIREAMVAEVVDILQANEIVGWPIVARLAQPKLVDETKAAGFDPGKRQLRQICRLPESFLSREERKRARGIAIYDNDRKRYADRSMPRVRRTAAHLDPMAIVVADVHPVDVLLRDDDGRTYTPRDIAFYDWSTGRTFHYLVFPEKGRGIRQADVHEAYIAMLRDPLWGVPQTLYVDNGGEFNWLELVDDAQKLNTRIRALDSDPELVAQIADRRSSIIKAMPYNAAAKPIEGIFGIVERHLSLLSVGWIGGDRMAKKTANIGRAPEAYPAPPHQFAADFYTLMDFMEAIPRSGDLDGKSPRQALAEKIAAGWKRMDVDEDAIRAVFARSQPRRVSQGMVSCGGIEFTSPELQALQHGESVIVRQPISGNAERLPVLRPSGELLCIAEPVQVRSPLDPAGARQSSLLRAHSRQSIAARRLQPSRTPMLIRAEAYIAGEDPLPVPESAGRIRMGDTLEAIGNAMKTGSEVRKLAPSAEAPAVDWFEEARRLRSAAS